MILGNGGGGGGSFHGSLLIVPVLYFGCIDSMNRYLLSPAVGDDVLRKMGLQAAP